MTPKLAGAAPASQIPQPARSGLIPVHLEPERGRIALMPRPTKSEIDAEIIDRAAGLFARHGFERTSIQQIADALGYSKAGLLYHYASNGRFTTPC